jgi:hypothetical protein
MASEGYRTNYRAAGSGGLRSVSDKWENTTTSSSYNGSTRETARVGSTGNWDAKNVNWGQGASRSVYNVFSNLGDSEATSRNLLKSRLWKGVPQLTEEQMSAFEAAYTGHQFIFVVTVPKFMTEGYYKNSNMHQQMKNLKAVIERASTGFNGQSPIQAEFDPQNDGYERKIDHVVKVTKAQSDISIKLHEFAGLPVKNALESWLTGIYDYRSEHGHYHGNLGIPGGWCMANHTMSILVVQTDPSWTEIQDAAYYYNMIPTEVPFDHFDWEKGEHTIIQDYTISFKCNEERSPAIMYAAEKYVNNRILSIAQTSVFNSRQFTATTFNDGKAAAETHDSEVFGGANIMDHTQYNSKIINVPDANQGSAAKQGAIVDIMESNKYETVSTEDSPDYSSVVSANSERANG